MTNSNEQKQGELIQFLQSAESVHGGAFNSGYTYEDSQYVGNALNQAIGFISRQSELEKLNQELVEGLQLVMKNSTNFRLKAPDYMIDKIEALLQRHANLKQEGYER